jgi:hypothetical protein
MAWATQPLDQKRLPIIRVMLLNLLCAALFARLWNQFSSPLIFIRVPSTVASTFLLGVERTPFTPFSHVGIFTRATLPAFGRSRIAARAQDAFHIPITQCSIQGVNDENA